MSGTLACSKCTHRYLQHGYVGLNRFSARKRGKTNIRIIDILPERDCNKRPTQEPRVISYKHKMDEDLIRLYS